MISEVPYKDEDDCPICCASLKGETVTMTHCGHHYHTQCFMNQLHSNSSTHLQCAICRAELWDTLPTDLQSKFPRRVSRGGDVLERLDRWVPLDGGVWGSQLVDLLTELPPEPRGSRRTQLLLARYVISEDGAGGTARLSATDRSRINRLEREANQALGARDSERITQFVNMASYVNRSFRDGERVSVSRSGVQEARRQLNNTSFRDLSTFLSDATPVNRQDAAERPESQAITDSSLAGRLYALWSSLFDYGLTRSRDGIQSPLREEQIRDRLVNSVRLDTDEDPHPWYRFGC